MFFFVFLFVLALCGIIANSVVVGASVPDANSCLRDDLLPTVQKQSLSSPVTSWAIVCLVRAKDTLQNSRRNEALANAILPFVSSSRSFTIQFFSEDNFPSKVISSWEKTFKGIGKVQLINVHDRGYNSEDGGKRFGYKWMCKFFTVDLYDYLRDFDYYLRIDSDNILSPVDYNIFEYTEQRKLEYAYVIRKLEPHQLTAESLPSFVQNYVAKCKVRIQIQQPPLGKEYIFNFYNNFHLGKVSFFNRPEVRHFLVAANSSLLYANRWGDSTIQAYAVRIFMSPPAVQQLPNVSYHHLSHGSALVSSDPSKKTLIPQVFPAGNWTSDQHLSSRSAAITHKKSGQRPLVPGAPAQLKKPSTPGSRREGPRNKRSHTIGKNIRV